MPTAQPDWLEGLHRLGRPLRCSRAAATWPLGRILVEPPVERLLTRSILRWTNAGPLTRVGTRLRLWATGLRPTVSG